MANLGLRVKISGWLSSLGLRWLVLTTATLLSVPAQLAEWIGLPPNNLLYYGFGAILLLAMLSFIRWPLPGQWALLAALLVMAALPVATPHVLQLVGGVMLCADGTIRRQRPLVAGAIISLAIVPWAMGEAWSVVLSWLILGLITVPLAWAARTIIDQRELARQEAAAIKESTEKRLAKVIHDSVARDLGRIMLGLESIAQDAPGDLLKQDIQTLRGETHKSLVRLRRLIRVLEGVQLAETLPPPNLQHVLAQGSKRLAAAHNSLDFSLGPQIQALSPGQTILLADLVGELLANALKYAEPQTAVELAVTIEGASIAVFQNNQIRLASPDASLKNGTGLARLTYQIESIGGRLVTQKTDKLWLVEAQIPLPPTEEDILQGRI